MNGLGIKYSIGKYVGIGAEWGLRKTTTDYLDDVSSTYADPTVLAAEHGQISALLANRSLNQNNDNVGKQRGNSSTKDWYSFAGAFIVFKIKNKGEKSCPAFGKHIYMKHNSYLKKD